MHWSYMSKRSFIDTYFRKIISKSARLADIKKNLSYLDTFLPVLYIKGPS